MVAAQIINMMMDSRVIVFSKRLRFLFHALAEANIRDRYREKGNRNDDPNDVFHKVS